MGVVMAIPEGVERAPSVTLSGCHGGSEVSPTSTRSEEEEEEWSRYTCNLIRRF